MLMIAPGGGYQIPPLSKEGLLDLYNWHSHLLRLVIKSAKDIAPVERQFGADYLDAPAVARLATEWFRSPLRTPPMSKWPKHCSLRTIDSNP
jgi:hypothetical protein